jgi:hypothetical protein
MTENNSTYSPENLQNMLAESSAYKNLPDRQKAVIQGHIDSNNKPVLMHIYYLLLEEKNRNDFSRQKLAEKIAKADTQNLDDISRDLNKII